MLSKPVSVVAVLGTTQTLAWGSTYYLPAVLANAMAAELGVSTGWIFLAFSAGLLMSAAMGPVAGRLIDTHGGPRVLASSNVVFAAGLALLASSGGHGSLLAAWLVMGVGMGAGLYEAAFSTLARIYGSDARRSITGITLIAGFASTICWPLSAFMEVQIGWRATCVVWALVHLALCLPLNLQLPPGGRAASARAAGESESGKNQNRQIWLMAALSFVFAATWFCSTAMAAHLPRLLQAAGASLPAAIAAAALVGPAQVAARLAEFWLMRRSHPVYSARIASLSHPVAAAGLLAAGAPAAPFFTVVHGAGNGVMTIAMGTLPLALFGAGGYGLRQGLLMAPARLLQAGAPVIFDLALTRYGSHSVILTAGLALAAFTVLMLLPIRATMSRR
jgi:MFS family permease